MSEAIPSAPPPPVAPRAARRLRILHAEDMVELQTFVALVLTRAGHHIETAGDGEAALGLLTAEGASFDLLLTDHQMPRLNGLELVRRVRELGLPLKIAVFASVLESQVHEQYLLLGTHPILTKPASAAVLRDKLEQLFIGPGGSAPTGLES